jgi:hypothetical protein
MYPSNTAVALLITMLVSLIFGANVPCYAKGAAISTVRSSHDFVLPIAIVTRIEEPLNAVILGTINTWLVIEKACCDMLGPYTKKDVAF